MSHGYCFTCSNTGTVDCECGGDICVCMNNGELPCPDCHGDYGDDMDEPFDDEV